MSVWSPTGIDPDDITKPSEFRTNADESLVCRHRDISCCEDCGKWHKEAVESFGNYYWIQDPQERYAFIAEVEAIRKEYR